MNVTLPKGDGAKAGALLKPGEWGRDPERGFVYVRCPHPAEAHSDGLPRIGLIHTGKPAERNWNIDAGGNVTPSIYFKSAECGWHVFARLEGWKP